MKLKDQIFYDIANNCFVVGREILQETAEKSILVCEKFRQNPKEDKISYNIDLNFARPVNQELLETLAEGARETLSMVHAVAQFGNLMPDNLISFYLARPSKGRK